MDYHSLKYKYKTSSVVVKLIVINVAIFLAVWLGSFFIGKSQTALTQWFVLPSDLKKLVLQPWSLISYSFLHAGLSHILWNMLCLYWFGPMVLNLFNGKRFLTLYLLGALRGGLLFVGAYNIIDVFAYSFTKTNIISVSASVREEMIFIVSFIP